MDASVTLTLNNSPFEQRLANSERQAKGFGTKLRSFLGGGGGGGGAAWDEFINGGKKAEGAMGRFVNLFSKVQTPERRAERALSPLLASLASGGDLTSSLIAFSGRVSGLGLAIGVGVGAGLEIFEKLHESIVEVRKAHQELDRQMSHPLNLTSIEGLDKAIDGLIEKEGTLTHGLTNYFKDAVSMKGGVPSLNLFDVGQSGLSEQKEINAAIAKRQDAERSQGRNELIRANTLASLDNDPKRKALAELRFKFIDKENELRAHPDKGTEARLQALNVEAAEAEKNFNLGKSQRQDEFEDTKKLLTLKRMALSPEQEKLATAGLNLESINRKLTNKNLSPDERNSLLAQQFSTQTDIQSLTPKKQSNPFAFGTTAARNFEDEQGGFGTLAGRNRNTNDPNVFGSLANSAMNRGESPLTQAQPVFQEMATLLRSILDFEQKAWGTP